MSLLGRQPVKIDENNVRTYLEDGDTITLPGYCQGEGYRVGFGEVTTKVLPSIEEK